MTIDGETPSIQDLLNKLGKPRSYAGRYSKEDVSGRLLQEKVSFIQKGLEELKIFESWIERMTRAVQERFNSLKTKLEDNVWSDTDPASKERAHQNLDGVNAVVMEVQGFIISMKDSGIASPNQSQPDEKDGSGGDEATDNRILSRLEGKIFEGEVVMSQLSASFDCLESLEVKMCLLSLSVFPAGDNVLIKKRAVIYWWMGEGFVTKKENKSGESVAEQVFQELLNERFIKAIDEGSFAVKSFRVYPWVRRMLIREAQRNNFLSFKDGMICSSSRRAFLPLGKDKDEAQQTVKAGDVRTVFNLNEQVIRITEEWQRKVGQRKVEVLQLGRWQSCPKHHIEVSNPDVLNRELRSQKRLKYLSLRGVSQVETLSESSVAGLMKLEILDLRACHSLEKLPRTISGLKNLTHLDVSECYLLENMPRGVEQLSQLQVLKGFVIGKALRRNSCRINDLGRLQKLRKLSIRVIGDDGTLPQLNTIHSIPNLKILVILWGFHSDSQENQPIALPKGLMKLDLRFVPFTNLAEGIQPKQQVERLYIYGGKLSTFTTEQGTTWNCDAKFVRLHYLKLLKLDKATLMTVFPKCPNIIVLD